VPRRLSVPRRTLGLIRQIRICQRAVYAVFQTQGNGTIKYLRSKGIHKKLFEDAQYQRAKYLYTPDGTARSEQEIQARLEKSKQDIKPPYGLIGRVLKDWKRNVAKKKMERTLYENNLKAGQVGGNTALSKMGVVPTFRLRNKRLIESLKARGFKIGGVVNDNTLKQFQKILVDRYYYNGESPYEVEKAIRGLFKNTYKNRSMTIARTETGIAQMEVQTETFKQNDIKRKYWMAIVDDRTRDTHEAAETEGDIPMDEKFQATHMLWPFDSSGKSDDIVNCRCDLGIVNEKREKDSYVWTGEDAKS